MFALMDVSNGCASGQSFQIVVSFIYTYKIDPCNNMVL